MLSYLCSFVLLALLPYALSSPISKRSVTGPVISANFPDPSFILVSGTWYAFATNGNGVHVQVATSPDFNTWTVLSGYDALPNVGSWSNGGDVWAPDIITLTDGSFVLYYSAKLADGSTHCVGAATSKTPKGPFTPVGGAIACPKSQGGAIDASGFTDIDGSIYLLYKVDGNSIGHGGNCNNGVDPLVPTPIMIQRMSENGLSAVGSPTQILDRGTADGPLVEAPSLVRSAGGVYVLFFSSNCYAGALYDISYATASSVAGPYTKSSAPLLTTGNPYGQLYSPGGADVARDGTKLVFHADLGTSANTRQMYTAAITISGTKVTI